MGKAQVVSNWGEGKYSIRHNFGHEYVNAEIARLEKDITIIEGIIAGLSAGYERSKLRLLVSAKQARKRFLANHDLNDLTEYAIVWCVDYTDDIEIGSIVATIDVPGGREFTNIKAGYKGAWTHSEATDGVISGGVNMSPEALFVNLALKPGWQKWMPKYIYGIITGINYDTNTCSLKPDSYVSDLYRLDITQEEKSYVDVPVDYMGGFDTLAFRLNDHVVVEFLDQDPDQPTVIGFVKEPVPPTEFLCIDFDDKWVIWDVYRAELLRWTNEYGSLITYPATTDEVQPLLNRTIASTAGAAYHIDSIYEPARERGGGEIIPYGYRVWGDYIPEYNIPELDLPSSSSRARWYFWDGTLSGQYTDDPYYSVLGRLYGSHDVIMYDQTHASVWDYPSVLSTNYKSFGGPIHKYLIALPSRIIVDKNGGECYYFGISDLAGTRTDPYTPVDMGDLSGVVDQNEKGSLYVIFPNINASYLLLDWDGGVTHQLGGYIPTSPLGGYVKQPEFIKAHGTMLGDRTIDTAMSEHTLSHVWEASRINASNKSMEYFALAFVGWFEDATAEKFDAVPEQPVLSAAIVDLYDMASRQRGDFHANAYIDGVIGVNDFANISIRKFQ